jgi:hypothetical protein
MLFSIFTDYVGYLTTYTIRCAAAQYRKQRRTTTVDADVAHQARDFTQGASSRIVREIQGEIMSDTVTGRPANVAASALSSVVKPAAKLDQNTFLERREAQFGAARTMRTAALANSAASTVKYVVDSAPDGYGQVIQWDANDIALAVVAFVAAADDLGVMITGAQPGDQISWVSATGIASFSTETKNSGVASVIGMIGEAASIGAAIFGYPEAVKFINEGAQYAAKQFPESTSPSKARDPFGVEPSTGLKARAEGGILISLPQAGQAYYSGDSDHQSRWIKSPGDRIPRDYPDHIPSENAVFLSPLMRREVYATTAGDFIVYPWDWMFSDNTGYYRLELMLTRAAAVPPVQTF